MYNHRKIEKKWQKIWEEKKIWRAEDDSKKPKYYSLIEFPYPSGDGLHVGHVRSNTAMDIISRKRRMEGYNVLYPIGWDAFGLPTENYAIKTGIAPDVATKKNTNNFRRQLKSLGFSFDWDREINTTDPEYYKWTQWLFLKFFENGLAYKTKSTINWCPNCKIGLANEEVTNGVCHRCGGLVEKKEKEQWMLKITAYAEKLLAGLGKVNFLEEIKTQQRNWIGRSEGALISFQLLASSLQQKIEIFTTRPDTLAGATYLVLAPEHSFIANNELGIRNYGEIEKYIIQSKNKTELDRRENKEKTGVEIKDLKAINPLTNEQIPIWISDYVLGDIGTGAIMAVPAHDERDFKFAKKFNLPIKMVVCPNYPEKSCPILDRAYEGDGSLVDSGKFSGLDSEKAKQEITKFVGGEKKIQYKLRDWVFSRQRYWGEPIPLVFCENCANRHPDPARRDEGSPEILLRRLADQNDKLNAGELLNPGWFAIAEENLPVVLPKVKNYQPRDDGQSPLASVKKWVNISCPKCGGPATRETDTMPNWAGSSWYYLAYILSDDLKNNPSQSLETRNWKLKYWLPVDWYNGGMEHVTLHLLYSRFWNIFLHDIGLVPYSEPYQKRTAHGLVLGEGGAKMSKSKGNVINPDSLVENFGADALRLYEMFMGPFADSIPWDHHGIVGMSRFLNKVWNLFSSHLENFSSHPDPARREKDLRDSSPPRADQNDGLERLLRQTIKKVSEDIEEMKFNTAISALMILLGHCEKAPLCRADVAIFLKLLFPFAPHISQELWELSGNKTLLDHELWPTWDKKLIIEEEFDLIIQINGKFRGTVKAKKDIDQKSAEELATAQDSVQKWLADQKIKKVVFVKNRLINFLMSDV